MIFERDDIITTFGTISRAELEALNKSGETIEVIPLPKDVHDNISCPFVENLCKKQCAWRTDDSCAILIKKKIKVEPGKLCPLSMSNHKMCSSKCVFFNDGFCHYNKKGR